MILHPPAWLFDLSLLLMRLMVGAVFVTGGLSHAMNPAARSRDIEMSKGFTVFLGVCELLGGLGIILGVLTQWAALGLILLMLGAIQKKIFVWKTGFWGEKSMGWHYDLMLMSMNLVILATAGGQWVISG